jgi:hypothetical protein
VHTQSITIEHVSIHRVLDLPRVVDALSPKPLRDVMYSETYGLASRLAYHARASPYERVHYEVKHQPPPLSLGLWGLAYDMSFQPRSKASFFYFPKFLKVRKLP